VIDPPIKKSPKVLPIRLSIMALFQSVKKKGNTGIIAQIIKNINELIAASIADH
jgi:hypothetical protein